MATDAVLIIAVVTIGVDGVDMDTAEAAAMAEAVVMAEAAAMVATAHAVYIDGINGTNGIRYASNALSFFFCNAIISKTCFLSEMYGSEGCGYGVGCPCRGR